MPTLNLAYNEWNELYKNIILDKNGVEAYPDYGALKRYGDRNIALPFGEKIRDGKDKIIYSDKLHNGGLAIGRNVIVRDDIIDGGLTFIKFAELLKQYGAQDLYLFATHGIFSKGFDELLKHYKHIWCTNSYKDIIHPDITCFDVYK